MNTTESERFLLTIEQLREVWDAGSDYILDIINEQNFGDVEPIEFEEFIEKHLANDSGKATASSVRVNALVSDNRRWKDVENGLPDLYEGFGSVSLGSVDCWITDGKRVGIGHYWKRGWKILYGSGIRTVTHFKELKTTELPKPPE